jgi:hypothetical protein
VTQVGECPVCKHKTLSSNSGPTKEKEKKEIQSWKVLYFSLLNRRFTILGLHLFCFVPWLCVVFQENYCYLTYRYLYFLSKVRTKDHVFDSVGHLIRYHMDNSLPIVSSGSEVSLKQPVRKDNTGLLHSKKWQHWSTVTVIFQETPVYVRTKR